MAHDVFISYAAEDMQVAEKVCRALEESGVACWMAPRDVPFGADYEETIVDAIAASPILILILSTHSNASQHVKREIQNACAEGSKTRIIPLRIDAVSYSGALRYYLGSAQWLDASAPPLEKHLRRLVEHARARLKRVDERPPVTVPPAGEKVVPGGVPQVRSGTGDGRKPLPMAWIAAGALVLLAVIAVTAYRLGNREDGRGGDDSANNSNAAASLPSSPTPSFLTPTPSAVTPTPTARLGAPTPTPRMPTPTPTPSPVPTPGMREVDTKIGSVIRRALRRYPGLSEVTVSVRARQVTLEGSVYKPSCRSVAEKLSYVEGVVSVKNNITQAPYLEGRRDPTYAECEPPTNDAHR